MATVPSNFVGPLRRGDTRAIVKKEPIYVDIDDVSRDKDTGIVTVREGAETFGSVTEYRRRGGGSGVSRRRRLEQQRQREAREKAQREREAALKEQRRIEELQRQLLAAGARRSEVIRRNAQGQIIERRLTIQGMGRKIVTTTNLQTGLVRSKTFKGGRLSGGLTKGRQTTQEIKEIKQELKDAGLKPVTASDGQVTAFYGKDGKFYRYTEAGIIAHERAQQVRAELDRKPEIKAPAPSRAQTEKQKIIDEIEKLKAKSAKLRKQGKTREAWKVSQRVIVRQGDLILFEVMTRTEDFIRGLPAVGSAIKSIVNDPKNIVPIGSALFTGIKADLTETIQLAKTSPSQAIGRIGTDFVLFKSVGGGFKAVKKISKPVGAQLNPLFAKIPGARVKLITVPGRKGRYLNIVSSKRIKVVSGVEDLKKIRTKVKTATDRYLKAKRTITIAKMKETSYGRAQSLIESGVDLIAELKAKQFLKTYLQKGGKLGLGQEEAFIKATKTYLRNELGKNKGYQTLTKWAKADPGITVKLVKQGRLQSAQTILKKSFQTVENLPVSKNLKSIFDKIQKGIKVPVKKVKKTVKKVRAEQTATVKQFKSAVEYKKQLQKARKRRLFLRRKGKTITIGSEDYIRAVDFIDDFAERFAKLKAQKFIAEAKKRGVKFGTGKEEEFIKATQKFLNGKLKSNPTYKKLVEVAKLNKPYQIRFKKIGKIKTAKDYLKSIRNSINKTPVVTKMRTLAGKGTRKVKRVQKKVSPKRIKSTIQKKRVQKKRVEAYKRTAGYQLRQRNIRKVTLEQLNKAGQRSQANKLIDAVFREAKARGKLDLPDLRVNQIKNVLKHRVRKAIQRGDKVEINKFINSMKEMVREINKPSKRPDVVIVQRIGKSKRIRTIKDFEPKTPKGVYQEVKSGQQVLLQKTETIKGVAKKITQTAQVTKVVKKSVSLKPIIKYGFFSVSREAFSNLPANKSVTDFKRTTKQIQGLLSSQDSKQDLRTLSVTAQGVNVSQAIAQAVAQGSRTRQRSRLVTKQVQKKKDKFVKARLVTPKTKRVTLSKVAPTYQIVVNQRGKAVRKQPRELTLSDAKDYLAYQVDNSLVRSGRLEPTGKKKRVNRLPKDIQGYYSKNSRKLRTYRISRGKKKPTVGVIEKRKYFQDTKLERAQAARLRAKARSRTRGPRTKTTTKTKRPNASVPRKKVVKRKAPVRKVVKKRVVRKPVGKRKVVKRNTKKSVVRRRKK